MVTWLQVQQTSGDALPALERVSEIELGRRLGSGRFATVDEVQRLGDQAPAPTLVLKTYDDEPEARACYETAVTLIARAREIDARRRMVGRAAIRALPGMAALPIATVTALEVGDDGVERAVRGALMWRVGPEYQQLDDLRSEGVRLDFEVMIRAAQGLAAALVVVHEELGAIHADLGDANFRLHPLTGDVVLLDFDGGGFRQPGARPPVAKGHATLAMAPELRHAAHPANRAVPDELSDRWSVFSLLALILLGEYPLRFLEDTPENVRRYLAEAEWPAVPAAGDYLLWSDHVPERQAAAAAMRRRLARLPRSVQALFHQTIHLGYLDPSRRPTAAMWKDALAQCSEVPRVLQFEASPRVILPGEAVRLTWEVDYAPGVHLYLDRDEMIEKGPTDSAMVHPETCRRYLLRTGNNYGSIERQLEVLVVAASSGPPEACPMAPRIAVVAPPPRRVALSSVCAPAPVSPPSRGTWLKTELSFPAPPVGISAPPADPSPEPVSAPRMPPPRPVRAPQVTARFPRSSRRHVPAPSGLQSSSRVGRRS